MSASMSELEGIIRDRVLSKGAMTFEAFMEAALYHPGLGYYASPETEIGRLGDFYTSPHLHPMFGAMLGRQAQEMWRLMGRPQGFDIVEAGGGRGWLAKDILDYLKGSIIYEDLSYTLIELNPSIQERQRELLKDHQGKVAWASGLTDVKNVTGVILSNELLDALPVHLIEMNNGLKEIYVSAEGDRLVETTGPPSTDEIFSYLKEFSVTLSEGYRTEVNLRAKNWLRDAAGALARGFIITVDYGFSTEDLYGPDRNRGTLLCYHKHQVNENPLQRIGSQDITAHVNFSALKKWGAEFGLKSIGFCRQGIYLVSLGIDEMIESLIRSSPNYHSEISKVKGLIMPGTMGDTHKVLIQYKGDGTPALRGFEMKNLIDTL
jgi:SAM-dependent MidA family methyltransferase